MRILSFDVGIKNLAYCLLDNTVNKDNLKIEKWDIINLCGQTPNCCYINKNKPCQNKAKFYKNDINVCKIHTKHYEYLLPSIITSKGSLVKKINNSKLSILKDLCLQFKIDINECSNKSDISNKLNNFIEEKFWQQINVNKADNIDLISLGRIMKQQFDILFEQIPDVILIENQISPIANRMKTLQGMIAQYFIDRNANKIIFVSASNKLKQFNEGIKTKTSYSDRKQKSIEVTKGEILTLDNNVNNENKWFEYFNKHKKK